jgi:hypothetical protein
MDEDILDVNEVEETEDLSEESTEEETVEEIETEEEEEDEDLGIRKVKTARFNKMSREAKLARKLVEKTGMSHEDLESYIESQPLKGQTQANQSNVDHEARRWAKTAAVKAERQELVENYPELKGNAEVLELISEDFERSGSEAMTEIFERKYMPFYDMGKRAKSAKRDMKKKSLTEGATRTRKSPEMVSAMTPAKFSQLSLADKKKWVQKNAYKN